MNGTRSLYILAALLAASGVALRFTPLGRPTIPVRSTDAGRLSDRAQSHAAQPAPVGSNPSSGDPIIAANIFAESRTPPTPQSLATAPASRRHASPPPAALTLVGTTIGPRGAVALINTGGASGATQVHAMGDVIEGARLVAITESTVTLLRPSGPLVLHVAPTAHEIP